MLETKEFYDVMSSFEQFAKRTIRLGSQGFKRENKDSWQRQSYYCDGNANQYFKIFLGGYSLGKSVEYGSVYNDIKDI